MAWPLIFALGMELVVNDPFATMGALRLGASVEPWPWLAVELSGTNSLPSPDKNWKYLRKTYVNELHLSPDVAQIRSRPMLSAHLLPFRSTMGRFEASVGAVIGVGAVFTIEDPESLQVDPDDPRFQATAAEWHTATNFGIVGNLRFEDFGLRLRMERTHYVETVMSTTEEKKRPWYVGSELTMRL